MAMWRMGSPRSVLRRPMEGRSDSMRTCWPPKSDSANTTAPRTRPKNFTDSMVRERFRNAGYFLAGANAEAAAAVAFFAVEADAVTFHAPAARAFIVTAVVALPAAVAVPVVAIAVGFTIAVTVHAGQVGDAAEREALVGIAVDLISLHADSVARSAAGDIESAAHAAGDQGITVFAGIEAPLLAGASFEGGAAHGRAIGLAHGCEGGTVHTLRKNQ